MITKRHFKTALIFLSLSFLSFASYAKSATDIYLVNHFGRPISFTITANPEVLPELSSPFTLKVGEELRATAVETEKQAYIYGVAEETYKAFWGLKIVNQQPNFYYYSELGPKNIAFSSKGNTITFCTVDEFKKKRSC